MKVIDESMLRATLLDRTLSQYYVAPGSFVTPLAQEFLRDRGIELIYATEDMGMPCTAIIPTQIRPIPRTATASSPRR